MVRKLALKFTLYSGGFVMILLVLYVAASGSVPHHMAVKKQNTTVMLWRFSHPRISLFHLPAGNPYVAMESLSLLSNPEDFYAPLFEAVERTPLEAPLDKYLRWWGVSSMRVCGNGMMIFAR